MTSARLAELKHHLERGSGLTQAMGMELVEHVEDLEKALRDIIKHGEIIHPHYRSTTQTIAEAALGMLGGA